MNISATSIGAGLAVALAIAPASAQQNIGVSVDGKAVQFENVQPTMENGRVMVPFRDVLEQMGTSVVWDESSHTIIANGNGRQVNLQVGSLDASVNGHVVSMDAAPEIEDGSTLVPLRFLSEALGSHVDWQPQNNMVVITTPPPPPPPAPPKPERPQRIVVPPPTVIIQKVPVPMPPPPPPPPPAPPLVIDRGAVIPMQLDMDLDSQHARPGDHISATIFGRADWENGFPEGTRLEGHVRGASAASGSHGGTLDVVFTHIEFPDGGRYDVKGVVVPLKDPYILRSAAGRFEARQAASAYVAANTPPEGAVLFNGNLNGKPTGGSTFGGSFGEFVGVFDHRMARNAMMPAGTRLGLILDHRLQVDRKDLH